MSISNKINNLLEEIKYTDKILKKEYDKLYILKDSKYIDVDNLCKTINLSISELETLRYSLTKFNEEFLKISKNCESEEEGEEDGCMMCLFSNRKKY